MNPFVIAGTRNVSPAPESRRRITMKTNAFRSLMLGLLCALVFASVHEVHGQATAAFKATSLSRVNLPTAPCTKSWRHVGGINDYSGTSADAVILGAVVFAGGTQSAPTLGVHGDAISENRDVAGFSFTSFGPLGGESWRYVALVAEYSASPSSYSVKLLPDPPIVNGLSTGQVAYYDRFNGYAYYAHWDSMAVAINNQRTLVGETSLADAQYLYPGDCFWRFPVRWTVQPDGKYVATRLRTAMLPAGYPGFPPGVHTELFPMPGAAHDINDAGTIVGEQNGSAVIFRDGADPYVLRSDALGRSPNELTAAFGISSDGDHRDRKVSRRQRPAGCSATRFHLVEQPSCLGRPNSRPLRIEFQCSRKVNRHGTRCWHVLLRPDASACGEMEWRRSVGSSEHQLQQGCAPVRHGPGLCGRRPGGSYRYQ